ncbi:dirigent protein 15-like [Hibiscus syriacus]|uniref:dirigent protein 15-like n=1 Tax=Hibiscus syriacus TaxID=106335 RepID=UPI0019206CBA|nr:dirigent protein 15-like [Hibiscus syriacus]
MAFSLAVYNAVALKQKVTRIQFYMHDIVGGPHPTVVRVAERSNFTGQDPMEAAFGSISVIDNPLTVTPNRNSTLLGRAQGIYAMSSLEKEWSLLMTLTYAFTAGPYNGSTFRSESGDERRERNTGRRRHRKVQAGSWVLPC